MRKLVATVALALVGALGVPAGAGAQDAGMTTDPAKEAEFVAKINSLRAGRGLATLEVHGELVAKARDWSRTMAEAGKIWHSHLPDGVTADWHRLGENVGMGGSVEALHQAFIDSPGHYENLVDPGFRYVGLGVTVDAEGTIFVSEVFMELASQPAPSASGSTTGTPSSPAAAPPTPVAAAPSPEPPPAEPPAPAPAPAPADADGERRLDSVLDRLRALDG